MTISVWWRSSFSYVGRCYSFKSLSCLKVPTLWNSWQHRTASKILPSSTDRYFNLDVCYQLSYLGIYSTGDWNLRLVYEECNLICDVITVESLCFDLVLSAEWHSGLVWPETGCRGMWRSDSGTSFHWTRFLVYAYRLSSPVVSYVWSNSRGFLLRDTLPNKVNWDAVSGGP